MIFLINVLHLEVLLDIVGINHHTQMLSLQGEVQVQIYPERTRLSTQSMHFNFTLNISTLLLK